MMTIMMLLFSIVSMGLKLFWKQKFLSGSMRDSIKDLWKTSWAYYKLQGAE